MPSWLRIGILGAGGMGRMHAEMFAQDHRVRIVGIADQDADRAGRLAIETGARAEPDLESLLASGLDLLVIATPNLHHAEASLAALERGVAVLCEKPMATSVAEARAVCRMASRPGAFYVTGHNRRHAPVYREVRRLVDGGFRPLLANLKMHEGDYRSPPWVADRRISGGFLYENLVHFFDLLEWLVGPVLEVSCLARDPFYPDLNDFVLSFAFAGGAIAALTATGHASWLHPAERAELVGDHAAIVVEALDRVIHSPGEGRPATTFDVSERPRSERWGYRDQDVEVVDAILAGAKPCFSPSRALRTLEIADACLLSAMDRRTVEIAPFPPE